MGFGARILVHAEDGVVGRGLLTISALHLAAGKLGQSHIDLFCAGQVPVRAAAEVLRSETELSVRELAGPEELLAQLPGATLFLAVSGKARDHLPLAAAAAAGVRCLVPVQFPSHQPTAEDLRLVRAAHDPQTLADEILAMVHSAPGGWR